MQKAKTRNKIAGFVVLASIAGMTAIQYLPVLAILASLIGHGQSSTPQWCNIAGGCPDK